MFEPIQDEIKQLMNDLILIQGVLIDEQNENPNNTCHYIKYDGMLTQVEEDIERIAITKNNIDTIIQDIMKNAADGNYSAKMEILERENQLLRDKIDLFDEQVKTINENLNRANKLRVSKKPKSGKDNIEENLEL